jgi:hypothetical protein
MGFKVRDRDAPSAGLASLAGRRRPVPPPPLAAAHAGPIAEKPARTRRDVSSRLTVLLQLE